MIAAALLLFSAAALVVTGAWHFVRAVRMHRLRRIDAAYRAAALVINTRRALRAGQHRAVERQWGRAA